MFPNKRLAPDMRAAVCPSSWSRLALLTSFPVRSVSILRSEYFQKVEQPTWSFHLLAHLSVWRRCVAWRLATSRACSWPAPPPGTRSSAGGSWPGRSDSTCPAAPAPRAPPTPGPTLSTPSGAGGSTSGNEVMIHLEMLMSLFPRNADKLLVIYCLTFVFHRRIRL